MFDAYSEDVVNVLVLTKKSHKFELVSSIFLSRSARSTGLWVVWHWCCYTTARPTTDVQLTAPMHNHRGATSYRTRWRACQMWRSAGIAHVRPNTGFRNMYDVNCDVNYCVYCILCNRGITNVNGTILIENLGKQKTWGSKKLLKRIPV